MVKVKKDGRTILTGKDYTHHKRKVWEQQGRSCADCGMPSTFKLLEFHHYSGRGMAGGKRDDLDRRNRMLCGGPMGCHERAKFEMQRQK